MKWPWQRRERREAATTYSELVSRLIAAQADGVTVKATKTAAVEAAAEVDAPEWVQETVAPHVLAQIGRDLIRVGESLHVARMGAMGRLRLLPCSTWYFEGDADPDSWLATCTAYGPSGSETWRVPWSSVVFLAWGAPTARPYHGLPPTGWASDTSRLIAEAERSLADESAGPIAQLIAVPQDGGSGEDDDPLKALKADIGAARGKAVLVETTSAGWGEGRGAAPQRDWRAERLGPTPADGLVNVADAAFSRMLAACGCSPALFDDSDGTSKREALRQWHLGTVQPLARILETELSAKLDTPVSLRFDLYNVDLAGRAQAFQKLVAGGVAVNDALITSGLLADG